mgnify:CR=1 FL=1
MSRESNLYTFLFVGIMIVGIASILAYTSQTLKPMQDENVKNEKMQKLHLFFVKRNKNQKNVKSNVFLGGGLGAAPSCATP